MPFLIYSFLKLNFYQNLFFYLFLFFAIFYSTNPIRAKSKPFIDSIFSASHYVFTAIFGYYLIYPEKNFPIIGFIFGIMWSIAMHAFSAILDIEFDKKVGIKTTAVLLGVKNTLTLCLFLYFISFLLISLFFNYLFILGFLPYLFLILISYRNINNNEELLKIYKFFPIINTLLPMIWSIYYIYLKFY